MRLMRAISLRFLTLLSLSMIGIAMVGIGQSARAQIADHCRANPTLEALVADMVAQNLSGDLAFWQADMTQVHLLLADVGAMVLAELRTLDADPVAQDVRDLIEGLEARFDLPLPAGGPLLPNLKPQSPDLRAVEEILDHLSGLHGRIDRPFDRADSLSDVHLSHAAAQALWAQARAYARDPQALAYVAEQGLILPHALWVSERFRVAPDAVTWTAQAVHDAILDGELTWVAAENIVWGWFQAGDRIRVQAFAQDLRGSLLRLRNDFIAGRPDFEAVEPFSGYFSSWQRWEDLSARLLLMLGQRGDVPPAFFHQTIALGFGETEPNIAALDASQLFALWHASGYQAIEDLGQALIAQRSAQDVRQAADMMAFFQVLVRGADLGTGRLTGLLERAETTPNARWFGGPVLMEAFLILGEPELALRAAEVAAGAQTNLDAPYAYVTPLIRIGQVDLAQQVLAAFHRQACSRIAQRSDRTYSWIDWMPLISALEWRIPVSRLDGV